MSRFFSRNGLLCRDDVWPLLDAAGLGSFEALMAYAGDERICHKRGRSVVRFSLGDRSFFLKRNLFHPTEFWKRLSRCKWSIRSAREEWLNIEAIADAGIATVPPIAFAEELRWGIEWRSLTLTEELYGARPLNELVTDLYATEQTGRHHRLRPLIRKVADVARQLHHAGLNHQDLYLNHFFLEGENSLFLIDLQRVQRRSSVPLHYLVKDLAQLNYSAHYYGSFSRTDRLRFLLEYLQVDYFGEEARRLWRRIAGKTERIARHDIKLTARRRARGELPPA